MKPLSLVLLLFFALLQTGDILSKEGSIKIKDGWKIRVGDNPDYSKEGLDDSKWEPIQINKTWDEQGYKELNGFAWYRVKVFIPSSLKKNAVLKDSIIIYLGKIDDYDQVFLNGKLIGVNCRTADKNPVTDTSFIKERPIPWNKERFYRLAVNDPCFKWDKENTIAVRVFDQGGDGGMFYGEPVIKTISIKDYFILDCVENNFVLLNGEVSKKLYLRNISQKYQIKGRLSVNAIDNTSGKTLYSKKMEIKLPANSKKEINYSFKTISTQCSVNYNFHFANDRNSISITDVVPYILTPKELKEPRINGAMVYGQRPDRPFLYTIAATGKRPMTFEAIGLPKGLNIDKNSGIITGKVTEPGDYKVTLTARNELGEAKRVLTISIGNKIALTPPMGWNSWNVWGLTVDRDKVIASAKAFIEKGLMNHGWSYINIDDGWEIEGSLPDAKRDKDGNILCNSKFPDMKALADSIHSMGLKIGIYSSPGPLTCGGYTASYMHEINDAKSYAGWGIDYLKYDWCSYDNIAKDHSLPELKKPYFIMNDALKNIDRDIVYSLCQYGMGNVWEWGAEVGGNAWRTTGDIVDTWESMSGIGFSQVKNAPFAKPGNWNDPDMLVVGSVGWGPSLHPTRLTPDEQYTHISLWCLLSAPLLIGCDLTRLDDFTLNLLTNDEVLALDQDPLGRQAVPRVLKGNIQVWVKELEDGSHAIGIFNLGGKREEYSLNFEEIGLKAETNLRDLWRQKGLGKFNGKFKTSVEAHGVVLVKTVK